MPKRYSFFICLFVLAGLFSCSKKTYPARSAEQAAPNYDTTMSIKTSDSLALAKRTDSLAIVKKRVVKRRAKEPIPEVITVNDNVARKSVDGRLYYDLQGNRYWRSNKDGKYYRFNKSMQSDPAFKKPQ